MRKIAESRILATHLESGSRTARGPWPNALAILAANCRRRRAVSRFLAYAPATVWAALLLFLGGRSDVPTADTPLPLDKAAHFLLYGLLGVLATWGWRQARRRPHLLLPLILAVAVGAADELHQRGVAGRSPELVDWLADTAGVITGCWLVLRMSKETGNAD